MTAVLVSFVMGIYYGHNSTRIVKAPNTAFTIHSLKVGNTDET